MNYRQLRKKYPKFVYEKYFWKTSKDNLEIVFNFKIKPSAIALRAKPDIHFEPKIIIKNINKSRIVKIGKSEINNLVFHLGLIEIPSYWKATSSPEIIVKAGSLNSEQITDKLDNLEFLTKQLINKESKMMESSQIKNKKIRKKKKENISFIPKINVSKMKLKSGAKKSIKKEMDIDDSADLLSRIIGNED